MSFNQPEIWKWKNWEISWSFSKKHSYEKDINILLVHGFGASKKHWRHNQDFLGKFFKCYAIDLLGFGESSQPSALLNCVINFFPKSSSPKRPINIDSIFNFLNAQATLPGAPPKKSVNP